MNLRNVASRYLQRQVSSTLGIGAMSLSLLVIGFAGTEARAGSPNQLLRGEAPVLFVQGERDGVTLRDGSTFAGTDDIILWVPQVNAGQVDLGQTGQFFRVWDSGPVAGPNGNDDNRNELRGLHFEPSTGSFLVAYDDTNTEGFNFGPFKDGDMMRMTPTSVTDGFIDDVSLGRVFNEGTPGTGTLADPVLTQADLYGIGLSADNSLFWTSGSGSVLADDGVSLISKNTLDLVHSEGFNPATANPQNIGADLFYEGLFSGDGIPSLNAGQLRGVDELTTGEVTVSLSQGTEYWLDQLNDIQNNLPPALEGNGQILGLDPITKILDIIYDGDRFFSDADLTAGNGEIMGFDVLDSPEAVIALANLLGNDSPAGIALAPFPEPGSLSLLCVGALTLCRRRKTVCQ